MTLKIYKATNTINGKEYIGLTALTLSKRQQIHFNDVAKGSTFHFHRAIRKHGEGVFDWSILTECETREEAGKLEIQLIAKHDTFKNGYNSTTGGEKGYTTSESTRKKISEYVKNNLPSGAFKNGNIPWNKGKLLTEEHKHKLSESHKGILLTEKHKQKISEGSMGKVRSTRAKQKTADALRGRTHKIATCPHCDKQGGHSAMHRWHFDNCKELA